MSKGADPKKPEDPDAQARLAEAFAVLLKLRDRVEKEKRKAANEGNGQEEMLVRRESQDGSESDRGRIS